MSLLEDVLAEVVDLAASTAKDAIRGQKPSPEALALQLAKSGAKLVGHEAMKRLLTQDAADRINAEIDAEP
jgi:hypothetical protein